MNVNIKKIFIGLKKSVLAMIFLLLFFLFLFLTIPTVSYGKSDTGDIIEICNAEELSQAAYSIGTGLTAKSHYLLTADIYLNDLNAENYRGDPSDYDNFLLYGWNPVSVINDGLGIYSGGFEGIFDGGGHTISGLFINLPTKKNVGFFAFNRGTIRNLNINASDKDGVTGKLYTGIIAGINYGVIENCSVNGSAFGFSNTGGICGVNYGVIENSINFASVKGTAVTGGICGLSLGTVNLCRNFGSVSGVKSDYASNSTGGICGSIEGETSVLTKSANYTEVFGHSDVGGISGLADIEANIFDCANYGGIYGEYNVGGICGLLIEGAHILNSLNVAEVNGDNKTGGICGNSIANKISNCFYDKNICNIDNSTDVLRNSAEGLKTSELINRGFLDRLNKNGSWTLPSPADFHFYPAIREFAEDELSIPYTSSGITPFKATILLDKTTLTHGEPLSSLSFLPIDEGTFYWNEPDTILIAGENKEAFAYFIPNNDNYGELYDLKVMLTVNKAKSSIIVNIRNRKVNEAAIKPEVSISKGDADAEIIFEYKLKGKNGYFEGLPNKAGKYIVRATYISSENYLSSHYETEYIIKNDITWLIVSSIVVGSIAVLTLIIYLTNKKLRYINNIKNYFSPKTIIVEKPVEVIKEVVRYIEPEFNSAALEDYMDKLTPRESEIAVKILEGKTRKEIAAELFIAEATTKEHISNILSKTYCKNQKIFVIKFKK